MDEIGNVAEVLIAGVLIAEVLGMATDRRI